MVPFLAHTLVRHVGFHPEGPQIPGHDWLETAWLLPRRLLAELPVNCSLTYSNPALLGLNGTSCGLLVVFLHWVYSGFEGIG